MPIHALSFLLFSHLFLALELDPPRSSVCSPPPALGEPSSRLPLYPTSFTNQDGAARKRNSPPPFPEAAVFVPLIVIYLLKGGSMNDL